MSRSVKKPVDSIDDVDAELAPRQLLRVADRQDLEVVAVDVDAVVDDLDVVGQHAEHRVVLEQVGHRVERAEVVHGDEVDVGARLLGGPEEVAADAAEAVDADANRHGGVSFRRGGCPGGPSVGDREP